VLAVTDLAQRRNEAVASRTRAAILQATIAVIAKHSLSGTTVQLVAEAAKVAPGTVILHFQKKDALLLAALKRTLRQIYQNLTHGPAMSQDAGTSRKRSV